MKIHRLYLVLGSVLLLVACGGGGGGGTSSTLSYSGSTAQATVTSANADELVLDAYQNGAIGAAATGSMTEAAPKRAAGMPRGLVLAESLGNALERVDIASQAPLNSAMKTASDTADGSCGGSMSYSVSYDDQSGDFSGTLSFSSFCEDEVTLRGDVDFSGTMNPGTGELSSFTMTTDGLTAEMCGDSFTAAGSINVSRSGTSTTVSMDMKVKDGSSGKVYWVKDYQMTLTPGSTYSEVDVSGRFYHPDYGYVDISTSTKLRIQEGNYWPSSGVIVATGSGGTKAQVTALNASYQLDVDDNGDGTYEYSESQAWSDWDSGC